MVVRSACALRNIQTQWRLGTQIKRDEKNLVSKEYQWKRPRNGKRETKESFSMENGILKIWILNHFFF